MANYATLKAAIAAAIKQNGNNEITGNLLQQQLLAMVNSLGVGYQYAGIATPETDPGTPDQNVFYLASTAGTYTNFDGIVLGENEVAILKYNGNWSKDTAGLATAEMVEIFRREIKSFDSVLNFHPISLDNYTSGYIRSTGDITLSGNFRVYYAPCNVGDEFILSFDTFDSAVARAFAVYSTDDVLDASAATLIQVGPIGENNGVYNIKITSNDAKLLCVQSRGENLFNAVLKYDDGVNNIEHLREDFEMLNGVERLPLSTNPLLLSVFETKKAARESVYQKRKSGLTIIYKLISGERITEKFIGNNPNDWLNPIYWEPLGVKHIYKEGSQPLLISVEKYIAGVECSDNTKPLYMSIQVYSTPTETGVSLSATIRIYQNIGGVVDTIGMISGLSLDEYAGQNLVKLECVRQNSSYSKTWVILNVKDMYDDGVGSFGVTGTNREIDYALSKELSNSYKINEGAHFPFENVSGILVAARDVYVTNYLKAILDIEVYGANEIEGFVYQIALLSKERTANAWGNGVWLRKLSATDYSVIEEARFKSPSAIPSIKAELDKIAGTSPTWMTLDAFGKTFRILVNGTYLESGYNGQWNASYLLGMNHYISPMCYRPLLSASGNSGYKTLRDAVIQGKTGMFPVGQNSIVGFNQIAYNVNDLRQMLENYKTIAKNPVFPKVTKSTLIRLYDDDSNMLYVCSSSNKRIFYSICPTDSKHIHYTSLDEYVANYFYFASKENPEQLTKVVLPSVLPGAANDSIGRKKYVFEMSNGDVLIEVENGTRYSAAVRTHNLYKISGLFDIQPVDGVITVPVENIVLSLSLNNGNARISAFEQVCEANAGEIYVAPYGAGITAVIYHSVNYGDTWEVIFCGIVDNQTLNIPPKAEALGTATAYGEWPTAQSIISSTPLDWSGTGNGNIHIHGIAYDPWINRLWVCTGDGSGYPDGVTGIWWTDDIGRSWHRIATRNSTVMDGFTTQLMFPIPMEHNVLFGTDGNGDGIIRWSRTTKEEQINVEPAFYYLNELSALTVVAGRWTRKGCFVLCSFAPDNMEQGDWMNRGGIIATPNGYDYVKIYEDEFTEVGEITPEMTDDEKQEIYQHAYETAEIGWNCDVIDCGNFLVLHADKGGIIRLDLENWK